MIEKTGWCFLFAYRRIVQIHIRWFVLKNKNALEAGCFEWSIASSKAFLLLGLTFAAQVDAYSTCGKHRKRQEQNEEQIE